MSFGHSLAHYVPPKKVITALAFFFIVLGGWLLVIVSLSVFTTHLPRAYIRIIKFNFQNGFQVPHFDGFGRLLILRISVVCFCSYTCTCAQMTKYAKHSWWSWAFMTEIWFIFNISRFEDMESHARLFWSSLLPEPSLTYAFHFIGTFALIFWMKKKIDIDLFLCLNALL